MQEFIKCIDFAQVVTCSFSKISTELQRPVLFYLLIILKHAFVAYYTALIKFILDFHVVK